MRGEVDCGKGSWWTVWSETGAWGDMVVEAARDEHAARAVRDMRYEVHRAAFSLSVRTAGGEVGVLRAAHQEVKDCQFMVLNGPGAKWFAVYSYRGDWTAIRCLSYEECMAELESFQNAERRYNDLYAVRADDVGSAERILKSELGGAVELVENPMCSVPPVMEELVGMPAERLAALICRMHDQMVEWGQESLSLPAWLAREELRIRFGSRKRNGRNPFTDCSQNF